MTVSGGSQLLTAVSTYTGPTTINNGATLNLNAGVLGNTAVTIKSGGTLTGIGNNSTTGLIGGTVTAAGGSAISLLNPATAGLTVAGGITLGDPANAYGTANSYSTLNYTLGASNSVEQLNTPGVLTLNIGGAYINITDPSQQGSLHPREFRLACWAPAAFSLSSSTPGVRAESVGRDSES